MKTTLLQPLVPAFCRRLSVTVNRMKYAARNSRLLAGLALMVLPLLALSFLASPAGAQTPVLGITNDPVSGVSVSWPVADAAYSLEWTADLVPPVVWQPFSARPALSADANSLVVNVASLEANSPQAFFLLVYNPVVVPAAPTVVTTDASPVNYTGAELQGTVQPNLLDTTWWFEWGTTTSYGQTTASAVVPGTNTSPVSVYIGITGLSPGTTYHFQLYGSNSNGISSGGDLTLTTPAAQPDATVQTSAAGSVTTTSAELNGSVNPNGSLLTGFFQWGLTTNYGSNTPNFYDTDENFQAVNESYALSGLAPNTTYHYRIISYNGGPDEAVGNDVVFVTSAAVQQTPPTVITGSATPTSSTSETISGTINPNGAPTTGTFVYYTSGGGVYSIPFSAGSGESSVNYETNLTGLMPDTTYTYDLTAYNSGGSSQGTTLTFTTGSSQLPPAVTILRATTVSPTSEGFNGTVNPEGAPTTYAFAYGTSPTSITTWSGTFPAGNNSSFNSVSNTVGNLVPGTTYYYVIMASNSGGSTTSAPVVFTTATAQIAPSATTLAASSISSNSVTMSGIVNPNGADTITYWEWGTSTSYGHVVGGANIGGGETTIGQVWELGGLAPFTTYHYQIFASNYLGMVTYGGDTNFTTGLAGSTAGMAPIPAGTFTMGDPTYEELDATPTVSVFVSEFYMDVNLVSYGQWLNVLSYATNNGYSFTPYAGASKSQAGNQPVFDVNWYDCVKWCNARSQMAGLTPVYYTDSGFTDVYTSGEDDVIYPNWSANGYRLPTEAEWEKAARGGLNGQRFPLGNTISETNANYFSEAGITGDLGPNGYNPIGQLGGMPYTSPVGSFVPNGYGLYDMDGNEGQWCWDWYATLANGNDDYQPNGTDPHGPSVGQGSTPSRVLRGGDWRDPASPCALRDYKPAGTTDLIFGFRCVRAH